MPESPILIHVRFAPDGVVLAGGRGVFRLERARLDTLNAAALN